MNKEVPQEIHTTEKSAKLVYIFYLVGIVLLVPEIIGVIMAYANKADAPDWLKSHYQFQIRTFWIGSLYLLFGALLSLAVIGYGILVLWAIWLSLRCVKGLSALRKKEPHPNPTGWLV